MNTPINETFSEERLSTLKQEIRAGYESYIRNQEQSEYSIGQKLSEAHAELAKPGCKGEWGSFCEEAHIARSTADLWRARYEASKDIPLVKLPNGKTSRDLLGSVLAVEGSAGARAEIEDMIQALPQESERVRNAVSADKTVPADKKDAAITKAMSHYIGKLKTFIKEHTPERPLTVEEQVNSILDYLVGFQDQLDSWAALYEKDAEATKVAAGKFRTSLSTAKAGETEKQKAKRESRVNSLRKASGLLLAAQQLLDGKQRQILPVLQEWAPDVTPLAMVKSR